ncbi:MAG: sulfatase-like hydrolase/transferase [Spirochaetales bacterium]|nr:sulfatase-like hydrolase/transferase [Spirochaetales bacterium]
MKKTNLLLSGLALYSAATGFANEIEQPIKQPNVLILYSDDHGYTDFGYLKEEIKTPNLDKLAEISARFSNAYASSPISSPSRCGIMTGQYQQRFGNTWYAGKGLSPKVKTMAEHFQEAGYQTSYFGKLHYGIESERSLPHNHGFFHSLTASHGGRTHYLYHSQEAVKRYGVASNKLRMNVDPMLLNGEEVDRDGFTTEIFSNEAQEFMKKSIEENQPFFTYLAFNAVHNFTWQMPKEYLAEWGLPEHPDWNPEIESYESWYQKQISPNLELGRRYYIAQLYYMDREIGKILDFLKEKGVYEDTIIVYTTDNGGSSCNFGDNSPLRATKYTLYEGGIRVPLFFSWGKKIKPGQRDEIVSALDLMPTLLEIIGKTDYNSDGINLFPYITNETATNRKALFWDVGWQYAIRKGDWKLKVTRNPAMSKFIENYEHAYPGTGTELFNLKDDPSETTNLAKQNWKKVLELKREYRKWKRSIK